jgi:ATP/maltotriose-dependent transcriptional regulator MalT
MRILTHLSSTAAQESATLGAFTQEGIAAATHSGRTTATKWLTRMEAAGLVVGERAHVPGHRVRKTVYHLSHDGWVEAMKLRARLTTDIVEVEAPGLDPTPMRVAEIPEIFPAYVNLTAAVSLVKGGRLDFTKLHGISSGEVAPVLWGDTLRRLGRLFGRADEFRSLDTWASSQSSLLVVSGIAGIGKSTLVASWLVRQRPRPYIYWFEIHEGTTRAIFLRDLAEFLARLGRRGLKNLFAERRTEDPQVTARVLAHDLREIPILLVLDNYHRATPELTAFVAGPIIELGQSASTKVLLISRTLPTSLVRRKAAKGKHLEILRVTGLDMDASLSLLRAKGFAGDEVGLQRVASSARGHPILLSFAAQTGSAVSGEMTRYLEHEIWRTLSKEERTVLEASSLFRGLIPLDALHCFSREWQAAVHGLQAKNLLAPTISGGVVVHDTIREYIRERLPVARRRSFHSLAATFFLDGSEMRDRIEGVYHLVESEDVKAFGEYLVSHDRDLLDSIPASELLAVLRRIGSVALDPVPACILPEVKGDALRASGDLRPALLEYRHGVQRAESNARPERIPRLLRKIASIERCRNEHARALGHLVEAQGRLESNPVPSETGEVLREMALLEQAKGDLTRAAVHMNDAVDIATEVSEPGALSRSLTALGTIETRRGNPERGLEFKREGLRVAERGGNLTETSRASISVGASLHEIQRHEEALKYYDRALQVARVVGNIRLQGYALMNRSAAMMDLGLYKEAEPMLEEAKRLVQILEERDTLALLDIADGQREMGLGRWNRAIRLWDRSLHELKLLGDLSDYARALLCVGRFYLEHGDHERSLAMLQEAETITRAIGDTTLTATISELLKRAEVPDVPPSTPSRAKTD